MQMLVDSDPADVVLEVVPVEVKRDQADREVARIGESRKSQYPSVSPSSEFAFNKFSNFKVGLGLSKVSLLIPLIGLRVSLFVPDWLISLSLLTGSSAGSYPIRFLMDFLVDSRVDSRLDSRLDSK